MTSDEFRLKAWLGTLRPEEILEAAVFGPDAVRPGGIASAEPADAPGAGVLRSGRAAISGPPVRVDHDVRLGAYGSSEPFPADPVGERVAAALKRLAANEELVHRVEPGGARMLRVWVESVGATGWFGFYEHPVLGAREWMVLLVQNELDAPPAWVRATSGGRERREPANASARELLSRAIARVARAALYALLPEEPSDGAAGRVDATFNSLLSVLDVDNDGRASRPPRPKPAGEPRGGAGGFAAGFIPDSEA